MYLYAIYCYACYIIMGMLVLLMSLLLFYIVSRCLNASYDFILWSMKALLGYRKMAKFVHVWKELSTSAITNNKM